MLIDMREKAANSGKIFCIEVFSITNFTSIFVLKHHRVLHEH